MVHGPHSVPIQCGELEPKAATRYEEQVECRPMRVRNTGSSVGVGMGHAWQILNLLMDSKAGLQQVHEPHFISFGGSVL